MTANSKANICIQHPIHIKSHLCLQWGIRLYVEAVCILSVFTCLSLSFLSLSPSFTPSICCCSSETNYGEYCAVTDCYTCSEITGDTLDSGKQVRLFLFRRCTA